MAAVVSQIGSTETLVRGDVLHHEGRFVDHGVFGDAGFEINSVADFDVIPEPNRGFHDERFGVGLLQRQHRPGIGIGDQQGTFERYAEDFLGIERDITQLRQILENRNVGGFFLQLPQGLPESSLDGIEGLGNRAKFIG